MSKYILIDETQQWQEEQEDVQECLSVLHFLSGEQSSILVFAKINTRGNGILPVGEGTVILGASVAGIPEHPVDNSWPVR